MAPDDPHPAHPHHAHRHASYPAHPAHLDEAHWRAWAADAELEGEVLLAFVTDSARSIAGHRGPGAPPVQRIIDIGSGPGVGTCELARCFPEAHVVAVDGSTAMLERAARRAADHGLAARVTTHLAELPDGLDDLAPADVVWASMSLHHLGDVVSSLRQLRRLLAPSGLLAVVELGDPMRVLPDDLGPGLGTTGLAGRLDARWASWFAEMREGLPGSVPSDDLPTMVATAGFEIVDARLARVELPPPLSPAARRFVVAQLRRTRDAVGALDAEDRATLDVLLDDDDPRGAMQRPDVFVAASRQVVIARDAPSRPRFSGV
ncbi:MAG: class I SAM-dependent methyltransferase [Ilumatobacteraceae bacterium]